MTYRQFTMILIVIMMMMLLGCVPQPQKTVDSAPAQASPEKILRIGVMSDMGAVPFVWAEEKGFFKARGITVEIQVFKSAVDRDTALQTGNLDGTMADMLAVLFFKQAGVDVKMTSQTYGDYKLITAPTLSKDAFLALDKKTIGLSSHTVIEFATDQIAKAADFQGTVEKVAIPQMPIRLEMLNAGELSGATLPEPLATYAEQDGGTLIGSTSELKLYPGIFMMTSVALEEKEQEIIQFYMAYNDAVLDIQKSMDGELLQKVSERLGLLKQSQSGMTLPIYSSAKAPDAATFDIVSEWMLANELIKESIPMDGYFDDRILSQVK